MFTKLILWSNLSLLAVIVGCGTVSDGTGDSESSRSTLLSRKTVGAFAMSWAAPEGFSPASAAHRAAEVLLSGARLQESEFQRNGARFTSHGARPLVDEIWNEAPLASYPELHVKYHARFNDLRVANMNLKDTYDGIDVGMQVAKERFKQAIAELESAGILVAADYDVANSNVSTTEFGIAPQGVQAVPVVVEYVFTALRTLNGIKVANAGVKVAVHRSGAFSDVRFGGVSIEVDKPVEIGPAALLRDNPGNRGYSFELSITAGEAATRFAKENPGADTRSTDLMYVLPNDVDSAVIEPKYVFSFSQRTTIDGREMIARRQRLGYSARESAAPPHEFGPSASASSPDLGDPRQ